ncbi:MAG: UbiA prenyltransferase family protein [Candidatus Bathyarchaeota archaeon]|nr:MAG: UbiA prenyltransferase family protein [Candidatus Bathyarchaeota archaeon]
MIANKISAVISQCRFFVLPLGLLAIISSHILAENFNLIQLFWTSLSFIFLHVFMASVNNTYDVDFDNVSVIMSSQNPIVTGDLSLRDATIINLVTPLLAVTTSLYAGFFWIVLTLIGIGLVLIYDLHPFRLKDRPLGVLVPGFYLALPFLFSYLNAASHFIFHPSIPFIFLFLFVNGVTAVRHIPDLESDRKMNVCNFPARYNIEATRILELAVTMTLLSILVVITMLGILSWVGLPVLLLTTIFRLSILLKPQTVLKNPVVWRRFAQVMVVNSTAILLSITGTVLPGP